MTIDTANMCSQIQFKMKIKTLFAALFTLIAFSLSAQNNTEGETFQLTKQGAHYVFTASINGTADATILWNRAYRPCWSTRLLFSAVAFCRTWS